MSQGSKSKHAINRASAFLFLRAYGQTSYVPTGYRDMMGGVQVLVRYTIWGAAFSFDQKLSLLQLTGITQLNDSAKDG